jgi:glycosyltransferase involved in cell wall biosynthesis
MKFPDRRVRPVIPAPVFFSIVSANYLAYAITLMQSLRDQHPGSLRYVVLADEDPGSLGFDPELFTLVPVRTIGLPNPDHFAFRYSILEFNTAIKPFAARWLAGQHESAPIIYLDPDIFVVSPLVEVVAAIERGALAVVTPHLAQPVTDDGHPSELRILRVGVYNLGFVAFGPHPDRHHLIEWWADKLEHQAYVDVEAGLFTDQSWMALAPGLFPDVVILRHPGYNLAYWNLAQRPVSEGPGGRALAAGEPISFIHFSGIDPRNPRVFSIHQNRFDATTIGGLLPHYQRYLRLLEANGYERYRELPYAWATLRNGSPITPQMRKTFRQRFDIGRPHTYADPFGAETAMFRPSSSIRTRLATLTLRGYTRLRAQRQFRWVLGRFPYGMLVRLRSGLIRLSESDEFEDPGPIVPASRVRADPQGQESDHRLSANLIGYLKGEFGVGAAARGYVGAAEAAHIDLSLINVDAKSTARDEDDSVAYALGEQAPHDVNLWCVNADRAKQVMTTRGSRIVRDRYNVGIWAWELEKFPAAWRSAADNLDEIWVASEFERASIGAVIRKPVHVVPLAVDATPSRTYTRNEFGLRHDTFVFLFTFDYASFFARKNPAAVVRAFQRAFPAGDEPVTLMLKSTNGDRHPERVRDVVGEASTDMRIRILDSFLSRDELFGLESVADAYVSLHRSEGFGLGLAESMSLGKPVIATGYSGNLEFMSAENSCLVRHRLVAVQADEYPYGKGQVWAEPDIDDAAEQMRRLATDAAFADSIGRQARADIIARFSPAAIGGVMTEALERIAAR